MTRRLVLVVTAAALIAWACSGAASSSTPPPSATAPAATASAVSAPSTTAPAVTPSGVASSAAALVVGGDRPVTVHVPASYDVSRPAPLLIVLHGYQASGEEIVAYVDLAAAADHQGFIYAAPDGTMDSQANRFWNATDACCNFDRASVDDVAYLSSVIADIEGKLAVDPKRIVILGHSNGGFMAYRMACERSGLVAAIVSLAGETFAEETDCKPSEPVSVAQVQGTADAVIHFDGGGPLTDVTRPYPGAKTTAATWAQYDGCGAKGSALGTKVDVDANLTDGANPAETSVEEWSDCDAGATVQLWTIPNGGHSPALTPAFADAAIRFLAGHPKP